jgi:hypothetical protein
MIKKVMFLMMFFIIGVIFTTCDNGTTPSNDGNQPPVAANQTPTAADFNISANLTQTAGSVTAVTVTPKSGKSTGTVTVYYEGTGTTTYAKSTTVPSQTGTYTVTFDVAAVNGWNAVSGLYAGILTINAVISGSQIPVSADYDIGNLTQTAGSVTAVTVTPKYGKSPGTVTVYYEGTGTTIYAKSTTVPSQTGTYTVTFDVAAANGWYAATDLSAGMLTIIQAATPITSVSIGITAPAKDAVPMAVAAVNTGNCTAGTVTWSPADNPFNGGAVYTASVILTAASGYTFNGLTDAKVNGQTAAISNNTGTSVRVAYTFPATDTRTVMGIVIALPPTKFVYNHGDTLDLAGLMLQVYYESESENVSFANFAAKNITASPSHGDTLSAAAHNDQPVTITCGSQTAVTSSLTVNRINPVVNDFTVSGTGTFTYNGSPKAVTVTAKPGKTTGTVTVKCNGNIFVPVNAGTYTVTFDVAADANYNAANWFSAGTLIINPKATTFTIDAIADQAYTGSAVTPAITVKDGSITLTPNTDYTVTYINNTNVGIATVTITGAGNYAGSSGSGTFTINQTPAADDYNIGNLNQTTGSVTAVTITPKTGKSTGTVTIFYNGSTTLPTQAGTYPVTFNVTAASGWNAASGLSAGTLTITKVITFTIDPIPVQTYTGNVITPAVTVKDGATALTFSTHYTVSYSSNTNAGTATVIITGAGNYAGSSGSRTFTINKAAGASVGTPTLNTKTNNSITINPVTTPGTGQSVEYAISTGNTAPSTGWQTTTTFNGLNGGTNYHIFARSVGNNNYETGAASNSLLVEIPKDISFNVTFNGPTVKVISVTKTVTNNLSKSGGGTITLGLSESFTNYEWYVGGTKVGTGKDITLNAGDTAFVVGNNWITAVVYEDAVPWSGEFVVVVTE